MISVLILDGFSDGSLCVNGTALSEVSDIFIPLLTGILRYNGILCVTVRPSGLEHEYNINGKNNDNLIYVPAFSCSNEKAESLSMIYTDATSAASTSFRIASKLRKLREDTFSGVVFVNGLHDDDPLKKFSPVIVDNIRFTGTQSSCNMCEKIYKTALDVAVSICEYYGVLFRDPAKA